ncbi:MAG: hypothetical protein ACOCP4_03960 [Candidatus Woesearchaeota archaeon]
MKKGQGLSMNVIVVTAVALIVLVVLIAIFTGQMGDFTGGISESGECVNLGGTRCYSESEINEGDFRIIGRGPGAGCEDNKICAENLSDE